MHGNKNRKEMKMKSICVKLLAALALCCGVLLPAAENAASPKELKVLVIGNSFSQSLNRYFAAAAASAGCKVDFFNVYIGGCPMKRHWANIEKEEANPDFKYFKKYSYRDKLTEKKWDVVGIQQASGDSWRYETYQPYAKNLLEYIRKHAPQAEVVIQQTWAYRPDDVRLGRWKIDQQMMYDKLTVAYAQAARDLNLRLIPVGAAVQLARESAPVKYKPFRQEDYKYPELPDMTGSYVGYIHWSKDHKKLVGDSYHLNRKGEFLQACVWFAMLFNRPVSDIKLEPKEFSKEEAAFIKSVAQKTVDSFRQPRDTANR